MNVLTHSAAGKIVAMFGKAVARGPDGKLRMVQVGDWIGQDEVIVTARNGYVQLAFDDTPRRSAELAPYVAEGVAGGAPSVVTVPSPPLATDPSMASGASLFGTLRVDAVTEALSTAVAALAGSAADETARLAPIGRVAIDHWAPLADAARWTVQEDTTLLIALTGRDPGGTLASVWVVKVPTGGVLYKADGVPIADRTELTPAEALALHFVPAPDFHGNPGPLQFMVVDLTGKVSAVATVGITVNSVNDAPIPGTVPLGPDLVAIPDASPNHLPGTPDYRYATAEDTALAGLINATDVDRDPMRFSTTAGPLHGSVVLEADGRFVYTPELAYRGADRFIVTVDDGHGGMANSTVFIDVVPAPAAPQALQPLSASAGAVFAWSLAEAVRTPPGLFSATADNGHGIDRFATDRHEPLPDGDHGASPLEGGDRFAAAASLELNSLLPGRSPAAGHPADHGLDREFGHGLAPGVDWSLRLGGLDLLLREGSLPAHA